MMKCEKCGSTLIGVDVKIAFDVDEGVDVKSFLCPKCDREIFEELGKESS